MLSPDQQAPSAMPLGTSLEPAPVVFRLAMLYISASQKQTHNKLLEDPSKGHDNSTNPKIPKKGALQYNKKSWMSSDLLDVSCLVALNGNPTTKPPRRNTLRNWVAGSQEMTPEGFFNHPHHSQDPQAKHDTGRNHRRFSAGNEEMTGHHLK